MGVIQGNTTGSISSVPFNIAAKIIGGRLVNRSSGSITVNLYVATDTGDREITPLNLLLISGSVWVLDEKIILKPGYYLIIITSGSVDYYFSVE